MFLCSRNLYSCSRLLYDGFSISLSRKRMPGFRSVDPISSRWMSFFAAELCTACPLYRTVFPDMVTFPSDCFSKLFLMHKASVSSSPNLAFSISFLTVLKFGHWLVSVCCLPSQIMVSAFSPTIFGGVFIVVMMPSIGY